MTRYSQVSKKILGLFGMAVVVPMAFSSAANAQYRIERSQIELTPACEVVDCNELPRVVVPPRIIPFPCDPRVCDPIEFEPIERIELERISKPVLEDAIRRGDLQGVGRLQQFKEDDLWLAPVLSDSTLLEAMQDSSVRKPQGIQKFIKFDE